MSNPSGDTGGPYTSRGTKMSVLAMVAAGFSFPRRSNHSVSPLCLTPSPRRRVSCYSPNNPQDLTHRLYNLHHKLTHSSQMRRRLQRTLVHIELCRAAGNDRRNRRGTRGQGMHRAKGVVSYRGDDHGLGGDSDPVTVCVSQPKRYGSVWVRGASALVMLPRACQGCSKAPGPA